MTEPSAEERAAAAALVNHAGSGDIFWLRDSIASALHAHAEAVRAELGHWSADAASRYAETRVEYVAANVDRWCDVRIGTGAHAEHQAGCPSVFHRIAAAIRAGATGGEGRDG